MLRVSVEGRLQKEAVSDQAPLSAAGRPRELGLDQRSAAVQTEAVRTGVPRLLEIWAFRSVALAPGEALLSSIYSENEKEVFLAAGLAPEALGCQRGVCVLKSSPEFSRFRTQFMYRSQARFFFTAYF